LISPTPALPLRSEWGIGNAFEDAFLDMPKALPDKDFYAY